MSIYSNLNENSHAIPQPLNINIELMEHQKRSIYAMMELEKNGNVHAENILFYGNETKDLIINTKIGILGDLMGAGKTLMIIAICLLKKIVDDKEVYYSSDKYINIKKSIDNYTKSFTNLIIIPDHLQSQWNDTFKIIPSMKVLFYNKNTIKNNIKFVIDDDIDIVVINASVFEKFMMEFCNVMWNRIIIDEADSIKLQDYELIANFIWLVTGTPSGIAVSKSKYIKNIFGKNINWITDVITIKNNNEYLKQSLNLPVVKRIVVDCYTPTELHILNEFIPNYVIQMINAGNTDDAIKALNCNVDTKDNIYVVIKNSIMDSIHNNKLEIEVEEKKKLSGLKLEESLNKIKRLKKIILNSESRLKAIQTKIKDSDEDICPVCMGDIEGDPVVLDCCGTSFCLECLAFSAKGKHNCIFCMTQIGKKSIHVIKKNKNECKKKKSHTLKNKNDALLEIIACSTGGVLVFANFFETFQKIQDVLKYNNITYEILKGNSIEKSLENFNKGKIKVLMLNALHFGAGLNLQSATDVVIYHRFTNEIEEQVIGRAQRPGRKTNLNVYYLIHENEKKCFTESFSIEDIKNDENIIEMLQ
jgi:SNF2 family DNA or RNA helicase